MLFCTYYTNLTYHSLLLSANGKKKRGPQPLFFLWHLFVSHISFELSPYAYIIYICLLFCQYFLFYTFQQLFKILFRRQISRYIPVNLWYIFLWHCQIFCRGGDFVLKVIKICLIVLIFLILLTTSSY